MERLAEPESAKKPDEEKAAHKFYDDPELMAHFNRHVTTDSC